MEIKQLVDQLIFCVSQVSLKEKPSVNQLHTTVFKCLCNIILAFLTFFMFFKEANPEIQEILQETYNKLILLKTKGSGEEPKEPVKIVHVKERKVASREGYTVPAHDVVLHLESSHYFRRSKNSKIFPLKFLSESFKINLKSHFIQYQNAYIADTISLK